MSYLKIGGVMVLLLALLGSVHVYLARRICHGLQAIFPKLRFVYVLVVLIILTGMLLLSIARPFPAVTQRVISVIGTCWMGLLVYLLLGFLTADLVCLAAKLFPAVSPKLRTGGELGAMALAILVFLGGYLHANQVRTVGYDVQLGQGNTSQMRVVMLSDVHLGAVNSEARLETIVARINEQEPDLVCIAGDFFDNDFDAILDPEGAIRTLQQIRSTYGVYACLGNHDAGSEYARMEAFLEAAGIQLLKDTYTVIDGRLVLAGRRDPSPIGGNGGQTRLPLEQVLAGADETLPVVMLDHNPASLDQYQDEVDLILSGHTHRGQIFPGNWITGAMYTVDYGYYRCENGTQIIVTSGAGTWGLPIRVGTHCEIVSIRLTF